MILIIGGFSQGKLSFAKDKFNVSEERIFDGMLPEKSEGTVIINNFNQVIKEIYKNVNFNDEKFNDEKFNNEKFNNEKSNNEKYICEKNNASDVVENWIKKNPDSIIISDEIGNGIIPINKEDREYREQVGRIQIMMAKQAKEVYRLTCGIAQKIK